MKNLPRITEIIKIEPFKITCRWTTGEVKVNDLELEFNEWQKVNNTKLLKLMIYDDFKNVTIKDGTLQWYSIMISFTGLNGKLNTQALDIDPDTLYEKSELISRYKLVLDTKNKEKEYAIA